MSYFQIVKEGETYIPISGSCDSSCVLAECDYSPAIRFRKSFRFYVLNYKTYNRDHEWCSPYYHQKQGLKAYDNPIKNNNTIFLWELIFLLSLKMSVKVQARQIKWSNLCQKLLTFSFSHMFKKQYSIKSFI